MYLASMFPDFAEQYGNDAPIDVMISLSHALFKDAFPSAKMSGIHVDKNGNWKIQLNVPATIMVETADKQWEKARHVYTTLIFKFKIAVKEINPTAKMFSFTPKDLEVT